MTVDGIVRAHRGRVTVESAPGAGTSIRVILPACDGRVDADATKVGADSAEFPSRGTILVIDDEQAVRKLARSMDVQGVLEGQEAVIFLKKPFRSAALREALKAVMNA